MLKAHRRIHRHELENETQEIITKYLPRIIDGILCDVTGAKTISAIHNISRHNKRDVPNSGLLLAFGKEDSIGIWFNPTHVVLSADTLHQVITPNGETICVGDVPSVAYQYSMFGFTREEIREILMVTVDVATMFPCNNKPRKPMQPDTSIRKYLPPAVKSHRILIKEEEIETFRAMVML